MAIVTTGGPTSPAGVPTLAQLLKSTESASQLPPFQRLRIWVQGYPGSGKTDYLASYPDAVHFDFEDTRCFALKGRSVRVVPTSAEDLLNWVQALVADQARKFKTVLFDTVESIPQLLIPYLTEKYNETHVRKTTDIRESGSDGAGWSRINEHVASLMQILYQAGYGWVVAGHLRETEVVENGEKKIIASPLINEGIRGWLARQSQYTVTTALRTVSRFDAPVQTPNPAMKLQGQLRTSRLVRMDLRAQSPTGTQRLLKDRLGDGMPDFIEYGLGEGYDKMKEVYEAACQKAQSQAQQTKETP